MCNSWGKVISVVLVVVFFFFYLVQDDLSYCEE